MSRTLAKRKLAVAPRKRRGSAVLEQIAKRIASPERMLELYYLSQEPDLLAIMRAIVAMPQATQDSLATFLDIAGDPQSVDAKVDARGNLVFSSQSIIEALTELNAIHEKGIEIAPEVAQRIH